MAKFPNIKDWHVIDTKKDKPIGIRLPQEMYDYIKVRSNSEVRTMNSLIVNLLKDSIEKPQVDATMERVYRNILKLHKRLENIKTIVEKEPERIYTFRELAELERNKDKNREDL